MKIIKIILISYPALADELLNVSLKYPFINKNEILQLQYDLNKKEEIFRSERRSSPLLFYTGAIGTIGGLILLNYSDEIARCEINGCSDVERSRMYGLITLSGIISISGLILMYYSLVTYK